jgi:predicted metallopeptidase
VPRYLRARKKGRIEWEEAQDIKERVKELTEKLNIDWVYLPAIKCMRSTNANTRAYARIWGLSRIWQIALEQNPSYIIEVISEKFDSLPGNKKDEVLLHEIAHIPKNMSGALLAHTKHGKGSFKDKLQRLTEVYRDKR